MKNTGLFLIGILFCIQLSAQKIQTNLVGDTINQLNQKNEKIGYWEEQVDGNLFMKGFYTNDRKDGMWITYFPNNMVQKIENYKDGILHGSTFVFDNRGSLTDEITYKTKDVTNGPVRTFSNGRMVSDASYKNGKLHSVSRKYYENSKLQEEIQYDNGVKNGFARWFSQQGTKVAEFNYQNGMFNGEQLSYFPDGKLAKKETYTKGLLQGDYEEYFQNGQKKITGKYVNDQKDGVWSEYDENGKLLSETKFSKGKPIK